MFADAEIVVCLCIFQAFFILHFPRCSCSRRHNDPNPSSSLLCRSFQNGFSGIAGISRKCFGKTNDILSRSTRVVSTPEHIIIPLRYITAYILKWYWSIRRSPTLSKRWTIFKFLLYLMAVSSIAKLHCFDSLVWTGLKSFCEAPKILAWKTWIPPTCLMISAKGRESASFESPC